MKSLSVSHEINQIENCFRVTNNLIGDFPCISVYKSRIAVVWARISRTKGQSECRTIPSKQLDVTGNNNRELNRKKIMSLFIEAKHVAELMS